MINDQPFRYKFYLAFEDALCKDYATERFFSVYAPLDMVPVVLGNKETNYSALAPPHSFIDASKFGSPAELAR